MASRTNIGLEYARKKAKERAKIIDKEYGEGTYGSTAYREQKEAIRKSSMSEKTSSTKSGGGKTDIGLEYAREKANNATKNYTDFNSESQNAYTSAKNKAKSKSTITSNLSEEERKARIKEIESEMKQLNYTLEGLGRAGSYGGKTNQDWLKNKSEETKKRKAELSAELKSLERVGTFTASELKQFEIEDAKAEKAKLPNYNPTARVAPSQVDAFVENAKAHTAMDKKIDLFENQKDLYNDIAKFGDVVNKDNASGQRKANYRNADLNFKASDAVNEYIRNPTDENWEIALAYSAFAKEYAKNNENALDDEGVEWSWINKSLAGYLPQLKRQAVPELVGGTVGMALGSLVGVPEVGRGIGAGIGAYAQSFDDIRGSVFLELMSMGLDKETALQLANDEALKSAMIEGAESGIGWGMAGIGGAKKAIGNMAKASVAKGSTNAITKLAANMASNATNKAASQAVKAVSTPLWKTGVKTVLGLGRETGTEYLEEFSQGAVSVATREKAMAILDKEIGRFGEGNIDLYNRPILKNPDGTISTVDSVTFEFDDGKFVVLPTIVRDENGNAKRLATDEEIIAHFRKTGEYLGEFDTEEEANGYANRLHFAQDYHYSPKSIDVDDGLVKGAAKVIGDAITRKRPEVLEELHAQGKEGAKIGLMMGGSRVTATNIIAHYANAKTVKLQNELVDAILEDEESLDALIEEGKASGEGTVSAKLADEIEKAKENGNVTRNQIKQLIESNEVYIKAEEQTATASNALEQAARDVVNERNAGTSVLQRVELLSVNGEQISVEEAQEASGYGENGARVLADSVNSAEDKSFSEIKSEMHNAYLAGRSNKRVNPESFTTDIELKAYTAGRQDGELGRVKLQEKANNKEPVDSMYDIPENSVIVNNIVVDEHSKRLKRENPRAYNNIIRMARRLAMNVCVVKNLTDENGKVLEGVITSRGIFINADAKNPSRFVATHEFGHRMKQAAPKVWAKYQEYVINKLKRESFGSGKTVYDVLYEETKKAYGKDDTDYINEEIAVNYAGELFESEEMLESFIREDKGLALRVRDWWYNVLESMGLLSEKKRALQLWLKAYTAAAKNVAEGKVGEFSGEKFKIITMSDGSGRKYVHATQRVIKSENPDMWEEEIYDYINNVVRKGEDVVIPLDNEESITITERTAWKTSGKGKIEGNYYLVKGNAAGVIDEIIEVSKSVDSSPPYKKHTDGFAKYGFDYRKAYFMDIDGKYYELKLSVGINAEGKEAYDIERIKRMTFPSRGSKAQATKATGKSSSNDNVPQNVPTVNSYSMQNSENNTKKEQLDIINQNNPAPNSYLTWIRTEDDIKTLSEALEDNDYRDYDEFIPDYTRKMAEQALATGKITVYSSYPITQGMFVTPSKMEAESYSGTEKVYEKTVDIKDVAWIDPTQGMYAKIEEGKKSIAGTRLSELVEKYGAIPKGEKPARDIDVPKKITKDKKVSQTVRTILEAKATPDEALPTIEKMVLDGAFSYDTYTDKQAIADAEEQLKGNGWLKSYTDWMNDVKKGTVSKQHTVLGWALYNNAVNRATETTSEDERKTAMETALDVLDAMVRHQRSAAQALQATRVLKKLSPETQLYGVQKSVSALQEELTAKYGKKAPELKIDEALAEKFLNAKTEDERLAVEAEIYKDIGRQMPSNWLDKWNAWRYVAMLANPRTHIRNIGGNAAFMPVVVAKDLTATAIESAVNRLSGKKVLRNKALITGNKADRALLKAAWNDYGNVADMISNGGKYNDSANPNQHIEEGRQIFKTKPIEWVRKKNSQALEKEDMWFSKPHYAYALAQYCKANNITAEQIAKGKAISLAREYAIREAQKATYRDTNAFSQMVSDLGRKNMSEKNVAEKALGVAIEGTLPFRKTPANILVRGVEYSPLGLVKGLSYDLYKVSKGEMSAAEAIDNISAGLTGTGLLVLGVFLAAQGLIRGHGEDEEKEKKFKELMGHQSYSLELKNGQSITLDWLAPEALPFFVGVNIYEATRGSDEEVTMSTILEAVSGITEPMLEMSCLQGINDLIESFGYASSNDTSGLVSILSSTVTSYLTQGIPTIFGQIERTGEKNRMTTYTEKNAFLTSDMQYTLGKISAKIPFLDYNQIPYIDAWGRKEASGMALKRGLNNFLNPAYTSTIETSRMEKELLRLFEKTGEGEVFPSRADKYFKVDGVRKDLTADEYVRYATLKGEKSYKLVSDLVKSNAYKKLSDDEKVKAIEEAYDYANQKAKQTISNYKPDAWVKKADAFGANVGNYISFKTEVSGTKEENGGKISKQEVADIILDMAQNDAETWKMYLSMYDSEKDKYAYNKGIDGETYMYFLEALNDADEPTESGKYGTYNQKEAQRAVGQLSGLSREEKAVLWQSVNTSWKRNPFR